MWHNIKFRVFLGAKRPEFFLDHIRTIFIKNTITLIYSYLYTCSHQEYYSIILACISPVIIFSRSHSNFLLWNWEIRTNHTDLDTSTSSATWNLHKLGFNSIMHWLFHFWNRESITKYINFLENEHMKGLIIIIIASWATVVDTWLSEIISIILKKLNMLFIHQV